MLSVVSADLYDKSDPQKVEQTYQRGMEMMSRAMALFEGKEAADFIEPFAGKFEESVVLVQKYEDLLKKEMRQRRQIVREMPVNERINIWKIQLAYHLATGKFSEAQRKFIVEMLLSISPETFASRSHLTKEEQKQLLAELDKKIQTFFTKAESFAIFEELGIQKIVKETTTVSLRPEECDCRYYCAGDPACTRGTSCSTTYRCGPWQDWVCMYVCK
jgi:hypothetical protein